MDRQECTTYRNGSHGWEKVVQATMVAILTVVAQVVFIFPSTAEAQNLPMADPESVGMSSERLERLDAAMQRYIDTDQVAGVVTLVARQGKIVQLKAQGHRYIEGGNPMSTDDILSLIHI